VVEDLAVGLRGEERVLQDSIPLLLVLDHHDVDVALEEEHHDSYEGEGLHSQVGIEEEEHRIRQAEGIPEGAHRRIHHRHVADDEERVHLHSLAEGDLHILVEGVLHSLVEEDHRSLVEEGHHNLQVEDILVGVLRNLGALVGKGRTFSGNSEVDVRKVGCGSKREQVFLLPDFDCYL
jgi:hypothetical protein